MRCILSVMPILLNAVVLFDEKTDASELEVFNNIFQGYQKAIRPVKNPNSSIRVHIEPVFFTVAGTNAAEESIQFAIDFTQTWYDGYLQWDPSKFNHTTTISVPEELIWLPDIAMARGINVNPLIPLERRKVPITYDGKVTLFNPSVVNHYCKFTIADFPFDTQSCVLGFTPWTFQAHQVYLTVPILKNGEEFQSIQGNAEWEILSFTATALNLSFPDGDYASARFHLVIKRNPVYYVCVLIIPTFIITTLCLIGIFAPFSNTGERQEKVSLGLTTLLANAVILSAVAAEMPKSNKLPLLGYFVIVELLLCTLAVLISCIIMFAHHRAFAHHWAVPKLLLKMLLCSSEKPKKNSIGVDAINFAERKSINSNTIEFGSIAELSNTLQKVYAWIDEKKNEEMLMEQWNEVLDRIDIVFLIAFQIANMVVSAILMV